MSDAREKVIGSTSSRSSVIKNFRQASGLKCIYRCGSTDNLADIVASRKRTKNNANYYQCILKTTHVKQQFLLGLIPISRAYVGYKLIHSSTYAEIPFNS